MQLDPFNLPLRAVTVGQGKMDGWGFISGERAALLTRWLLGGCCRQRRELRRALGVLWGSLCLTGRGLGHGAAVVGIWERRWRGLLTESSSLGR